MQKSAPLADGTGGAGTARPRLAARAVGTATPWGTAPRRGFEVSPLGPSTNCKEKCTFIFRGTCWPPFKHIIAQPKVPHSETPLPETPRLRLRSETPGGTPQRTAGATSRFTLSPRRGDTQGNSRSERRLRAAGWTSPNVLRRHTQGRAPQARARGWGDMPRAQRAVRSGRQDARGLGGLYGGPGGPGWRTAEEPRCPSRTELQRVVAAPGSGGDAFGH